MSTRRSGVLAADASTPRIAGMLPDGLHHWTATHYAIGETVFGLEAWPGREGELDMVLWSERLGAVIAGDTLIDLGDGLEIHAAWLPDGVTVEQVAAGLRPL